MKLTTIVEGDLKAPFSIATTLGCREGRYSIHWIAPLYPWSVPYNAEWLSKAASSTIFWAFGMTRPGIKSRSPGSLMNTLHIRLIAWVIGVQSLVESYQRLKKMVLDNSLLSTQHYKVRIKSKVEKSRERSSTLSKPRCSS